MIAAAFGRQFGSYFIGESNIHAASIDTPVSLNTAQLYYLEADIDAAWFAQLSLYEEDTLTFIDSVSVQLDREYEDVWIKIGRDAWAWYTATNISGLQIDFDSDGDDIIDTSDTQILWNDGIYWTTTDFWPMISFYSGTDTAYSDYGFARYHVQNLVNNPVSFRRYFEIGDPETAEVYIVLIDAESTGNMLLMWLNYRDTLTIREIDLNAGGSSWCGENTGTLQIPYEECLILEEFYEQTNGDNWTDNSNRFQWDGSNICGWRNGIWSCNRDSGVERYRIQNIGFDRQWNNMVGSIPASLYTLPYLEYIHMPNNPNLVVNLDDITSSIYANNFKQIWFYNNTIQWSIANFSNSPNLEVLNIACYTESNLDNCTAIGDTSFVPSLANITDISIGWNTGITLNLSDFVFASQLTRIYGLNNYVVWDVASLSGSTSMEFLDIACRDLVDGQCNVTGNLSFVQNMLNLQYLSLDALLNIEWTLDVLYDKRQLTHIDLSHNKISGTIGTGIGALTMLNALDINNNLLEWTLPEEMYNLVLLDRLNIDDNNLTGALLDFREFPLLRQLDIGANNMDYSNVWDMIVPEADADAPCYLPWAGAEEVCPGLSTLQELGIGNANIQWPLPDVWEKFPELIELNLQFNGLTGPFPASFSLLTNLNDLKVRFNNLDGEIPPYLANMQLNEWKFAIEANCLDTDVQDPALLALLTDNSPGWNNQLNCRANIHISWESTDDSLEAGQCAPYTIHYNNLWPQKAINLKIGQVFAENVVASWSTPVFEEGLVGREYGTINDPCYVQATQYGTWPYFAAYEYLLVYESEYPFASIYDLALALGWFLWWEQFTGDQWTTEFAYVLDNFCPFVFGTTDHYLCLLLFWIDMKEIEDPTCGYGWVPWYVRELWTIPTQWSGTIQMELCNESEQIEILSCSDINVDTISENENLTTCDIAVQAWVCGDGTIDEGEQCDDENTQNGDGCSATCQDELPEDPDSTPYCGDGDVNAGEQCDGTSNCNNNCTFKPLWSRDRQPTITIDYCPDGDFSPSYYDSQCGVGPTISQHGSAGDEEIVTNLIDRPSDFQKAVANITKSMQCNIRNELVQAYVFAFDLKITTVNNICNANLQWEVTREEFAKFISSYAIAVLSKKPDTTRRCSFNDVAKTTAEMQTFARISCELNIMGLKQNGTPDSTFRPKDAMTRAEVFTALNRLVNGTIDNSETGTWYVKHMHRLAQQKVITDTSNPQRNTLRGEVLLMLMRAYTVIKNR